MQFAESAVKGIGRKLAIAAMAATFGLGLVACGDDTKNTQTNGGSVTPVTAPKGTVVGQIVDTNGNPISGATVYIADGAVGSAATKLVAIKKGAIKPKATVTTNAAGQFTIANVVAQAVANSGGSDPTGVFNLPIQIFVDTPAGYLDATIQVMPQAQVVNDQPVLIGGGQTNAPLVFIDGFTASTGTVHIPALTTKVVGKLRDESTGAPVSGQTLTLDFNDVLPDQFPVSPVAPVTYGSSIYTATTGSDGSFEFTAIPDDSELTLGSELIFAASGGHTIGGIDTNVEGSHTTILGDLLTNPVATGDTTSPYVLKVDEVVTNGFVGQLASSFTDTFTIHLSEALSSSSTAVVKVTVASSPGGTETIVGSTAELTGNTLKVKTASPIAAGKFVRVYIATEHISDVAGNALADSDPAGDLVSFDGLVSRDLVLTMQTYTPPITGLQPVAGLARVETPTNADSQYYLSTNALLDTIEDTVDEDDGDLVELSQLNSPDALSGLANLIDALEDGSFAGPGHFDDVHVDRARVKFTTSGAKAYAFVVVKEDGTFVSPGLRPLLPATGVGPGPWVQLDDDIGGGFFYPTLQPSESSKTQDVEVSVEGVEPGQTLKVVSIGDISGAGTPVVSAGAIATLPLADHVPPTTTYQSLFLAVAAQAEGGANTSGGNLVLGGSAAAGGTVIYPVTPQLYDIDDTANNGFVGDQLNGAHELEGLSTADLKSTGGFSADTVTEYDATGAAAFLPAAKGKISINVTEPLADSPPLLTAANATTVFSGPGQIPGINDENGFGPFYVYTVNIDSTEKLQADARAKRVLDLTGIVDEAGNAAVAATKAKAELRDFMPPVMTRAFFDGTYWVFQFNEPVQLNVGEITLAESGNTIHLAPASASAVPADKRAAYFVDGNGTTVDSIIVIPVGNPETVGIAAATALGGTAYSEASYATAAALKVGAKSLTALAEPNLAAKPKHGRISYATVRDKSDNTDLGGQNGNSWANWSLNFLGINAPLFYGANILGPFTESLTSATLFTSGRVLTVGNTTFSVDLQFTHPLDLSAADTDANGKLSDPEVTAYVAARLYLAVDNTGAADPNINVSSADVGTFVNGIFTPSVVTGDNTSRTLKQGSVLRVTFSRTNLLPPPPTIEATNRINVVAGQSFKSAVDPNLLIGPDDRDASLREVDTTPPVTTTEFAPIAPNDAGTGVEKAFQ